MYDQYPASLLLVSRRTRSIYKNSTMSQEKDGEKTNVS